MSGRKCASTRSRKSQSSQLLPCRGYQDRSIQVVTPVITVLAIDDFTRSRWLGSSAVVLDERENYCPCFCSPADPGRPVAEYRTDHGAAAGERAKERRRRGVRDE